MDTILVRTSDDRKKTASGVIAHRSHRSVDRPSQPTLLLIFDISEQLANRISMAAPRPLDRRSRSGSSGSLRSPALDDQHLLLGKMQSFGTSMNSVCGLVTKSRFSCFGLET
jgi:hypothetical protein